MQDSLLWIRFDESDRYLSAPNFCLPAAAGSQVCRDDFRGYCNLVLVFGHSSGCSVCEKLIVEFIEQADQYKASNTCILVVLDDQQDEDRVLSETLEKGRGFLKVLYDTQGQARREYAALVAESLVKENDVLVFILDMYGAPYYTLSRAEIDHSAFHEEALRWLNFIGMLCPE